MLEIDQLLDSAFAAYEEERLDEAEESCRAVLAREPRYALALHLLGVIAGRTGRTTLGIQLLREAIGVEPESVEALNDLGEMLTEAGEPLEAISVLETAVGLDPGSPSGHNNLGQAYLAVGRVSEATSSFERAIALAPELAVAHFNLGTVLQSQSRNAEASACYRRAIEFAPDLAAAHARLGNVLLDDGNHAQAIASFRRAFEAEPESTLGLASLATALFEERQEAAAEDCLRDAIARDPRSGEAYARLGDLLTRLGRFDESTACFQQALILDPGRSFAYFGLVNSKKIADADRPLIARMTTLLGDTKLTDRDRANLHFALGKAFDDLADYQAAMRHFDEANRIEADRLTRIGRSFDRDRYAMHITTLIETFTPDYVAQHAMAGSDSELPVLIVGMPRSGTTLIEQILSNHPEIGGGDELSFWREKAATVAGAETGALSVAAANDLAVEYLELLRGLAPSAGRVTDKLPQNFLHLGLVHLVFPHARVIHCRRNPVDTCLSIYFTHFSLMKNYAFDRRELVFVYEQYLRLMAHWRRILPADRFMEVDYETLVGDGERAAREMVEFCGLDWDEACLHPESNQRIVRTASMWQARQPVYQSSVERWRRYEPWLDEFRRLLPGS